MKAGFMIRFLVTGGTIDKEYNELNGELYFPKTHLSLMLEQARCNYPVVTEQLMLKDSLEMSLSDREAIKKVCLAAVEDKILVTHGTDTMVETARHLAGIKYKTIILFGAMIPYSMGSSDALFNLGCAFSAVQTLQNGVYITMNGHIFTWDNVQKLKQQGLFDTL
jgi:L-asparaginase